MELLKTATGSARALLAAWDSADARRLQAAVNEVFSAGYRASDIERVELLEEIGCAIGEWMEGRRTTEDLDACLSLLRHLAGAGHKAAAAYSASSI